MIEAITRRRLLKRTVEGGMAVAAGLIPEIGEALAARHDNDREDDRSANDSGTEKSLEEQGWTKGHLRALEKLRELKNVELPPNAVPIDWQYGAKFGYGGGAPRTQFHGGIDIAAKYGEEVMAVQDGWATSGDDWLGGLAVFLNSSDSYVVDGYYFFIITYCGHLSNTFIPFYNASISWKENRKVGNQIRVKRGDVVGMVGGSGAGSGGRTHLHFEVSIRPLPYREGEARKHVNPAHLLVPSVFICTDKFLNVRPLSYPIACK